MKNKLYFLALLFLAMSCYKKEEVICISPPPPPPVNPYFKLVKTSWPDRKITMPGENYLIMQFVAAISDLPGCIISDGTLHLSGNAPLKDIILVIHNQNGVMGDGKKIADSAVSAISFKCDIAMMGGSLDTFSILVTVPRIYPGTNATGSLELGYTWKDSPSRVLSSGVVAGQKVIF